MDGKRLISFILIIGTVLSTVSPSQNAVKWKLTTKPAVFGADIDLQCSLDTNQSIDGTRQWSKGRNLTLLVLNGTPVNRTKYMAKLQKAKRTSVLTIRSLSVEDVNMPYTCQLGFDTYTDILNMTVENFEYHSGGQLSCLRFKDDHAIFSLKFRKVFPIPNCTSTTEDTDLTNHLKTVAVPTGLFYEVTVSFRFLHVQQKIIHQQLNIVCCVGTKRIEYSLQFNNDNCTDAVSKIDGKGSALLQMEVMGIIVTCLVCLSPCVYICIFLSDNGNKRKLVSSARKIYNMVRPQKKRQDGSVENELIVV